ncbi:S41 family peptidase [Paenibacillus puldeungensis]|uniref:S41 family peptidase n=2 Tax=Paenibacillus puldeungensis TaxID=696536 RepID=A0ABW3S0H7_9BACL
MKKVLAVALSAALILGFAQFLPTPNGSRVAAAAPAKSKTDASKAAQNKPKPAQDPRMAVLMANKNFLGGLSNKQMQEDYEYLWKTLRESYPFLGVAKRSGIDVDAVYKKYQSQVAATKDDLTFVNTVANAVENLQGLGHLSLFMSSGTYSYLLSTYGELQQSMPQLKAWYAALSNPKTLDAYTKLAGLEAKVIDVQKAQALGNPQSGNAQTPVSQGQTPAENITTKILTPDKIAYVKINSFGNEYIEKDGKILSDFYSKISGYDHLIIDITDNGGGNEEYWFDHIVAPNISKDLTQKQYNLFNVSANNKPYLAAADFLKDAKPVAELPDFPKMAKEDLKGLSSFTVNEKVMKPSGEKKAFNGKIWVLVNQNVYSSSEAFAMFCKSTGFATLVGTPTGGDGGGIDPAYVVLPNSGMVVRYSMLYGINPDGTNNEEYGTQPDFVSPTGESALDTCLKQIAQQK